MMIKLKKLSSLDKVFLDQEPLESCHMVDAIFKNETFSFQIAYYSEFYEDEFNSPILTVSAQNDFGGCVRLRSVGYVPAELPAYPASDEDYLSKKPGLFPDPLYDIPNNEIKAVPFQWRSLWVDFEPKEYTPAGNYAICIKFLSEDGTELGKVVNQIEVIDASLPKQELIYTNWFHCDCLGTYYGVEMLSDSHWQLIENYVRTACEHGMNMILTPLFTPPLDTKIGGERPTVQLVGVKSEKGEYAFDFSKLKRFIDMCTRIGIEYFEMSHLFTQWGAFAAPKVVACVDGVERRIFGWDSPASASGYGRFLNCFLPELTRTLKDWGIAGKCWFHVSDEPGLAHFESYKGARNMVAGHLKDFKMFDALSDFAFCEQGLVMTPIPATNHIEPFIKAKIKNLWTYFCCAQYKDVSNRFIAMPGRRNRIFATQLYKYDIAGFLHWGYNFWYSQYSVKPINPYAVTDMECAFPSGDPFMVYPGQDGFPVESMRIKVFREALFDLRAMKLLESMTSKDFVQGIIEEDLENPVTFTDYPRNDQYIHSMRNRINEEIKRRI